MDTINEIAMKQEILNLLREKDELQAKLDKLTEERKCAENHKSECKCDKEQKNPVTRLLNDLLDSGMAHDDALAIVTMMCVVAMLTGD